MKTVIQLCSLLCLFTMQTLMAQITYTSASLPLANDVISYSTALDSTLTVSAPSATASTWDFSGLTALSTQRDTILPAAAGASYADYPDAEILEPLFGGATGFGTAYVDVTATQIERLGGGIEVFGLSFVSDYSNTHITQVLPLTYPDADSDTYTLNYGENIDSIPFLRQLIDSLVAGAIGVSVSPDSIRFVFEGTDDRTVDAFGTCIMAYDSFDVIRQKVISDYEFKIEVRVPVPFIGPFWFDATSFLPLPFPPQATTVRYDFLAEGVKQPIVSLSLDSAELVVLNINFMDTLYNNPPNTINVNYLSLNVQIKVYPNPTQDILHITIESALPAKGLRLSFYDKMGRLVGAAQTIRSRQTAVSLADLSQGQYFAVLRNVKGEIVHQVTVLKSN